MAKKYFFPFHLLQRIQPNRDWQLVLLIFLAAFLLICVVIPTHAFALENIPQQYDNDQNMVLLEVDLDDQVLTEAITSYQYGNNTFLPLGELTKLLTLAISVQIDQGTAEGFVLSEARGFHLNVTQNRIRLGEQTQTFDPTLVQRKDDDIYVASQLLARWLPVDLEVNLSSLTLQVKPRERLPLQERFERERRGKKLGERLNDDNLDPGYPHTRIPYRLLGFPTINQTLGFGLNSATGRTQTSSNYTTYLAGDLLGMESTLFLSGNLKNQAPHINFTLGRYDPDGNLLGPLHANSVMLGSSVSVPSIPNVGTLANRGKGAYGLTVSNRPVTLPTHFDRHTLQGDLPPGWDVELYFNGALVGFQAAGESGRYHFDDQPLSYNLNEFRLVFHGPLGQQRVEKQSFFLDQSSTVPGTFYYQLGQNWDNKGQVRSTAQFEWGLNKYLASTGGLVYLPTSLTDSGENTDPQLYLSAGLRASWHSVIMNSDLFQSPNGGLLSESGFKTRFSGIALNYNHTQPRNFNSPLFPVNADSLRIRDKLRLEGTITTGVLPRLPASVEIQREQFALGRTNLAAITRVSAYVDQTSISNQLSWNQTGDRASSSGDLQLSRRFGVIGINGDLSYQLKPEAELSAITLSGNKRFNEGLQLDLGLGYSIQQPQSIQITANLNKSLGNYGFRLSSSYADSGAFSLGLQLFSALSKEPRQAKWHFDAQSKSDTGEASAQVFLDKNNNGVMDADDEPIQKVGITAGGGQTVLTDSKGIAWLDHLPIKQYVDISIQPQTLEDSSWTPQHKGLRLVPRPGRVAKLDFPILLTGEIDGTVYLANNDSKRGVGNVVIELLDMERKIVSSITNDSDGFYIIPAVVQGHYFVRVSPKQLKQLNLADPGVHEITILPDGTGVSGIDFILKKRKGLSVLD